MKSLSRVRLISSRECVSLVHMGETQRFTESSALLQASWELSWSGALLHDGISRLFKCPPSRQSRTKQTQFFIANNRSRRCTELLCMMKHFYFCRGIETIQSNLKHLNHNLRLRLAGVWRRYISLTLFSWTWYTTPNEMGSNKLMICNYIIDSKMFQHSSRSAERRNMCISLRID